MINNDLNLTLKRVSMSNSNRFTLPNLQYTQRFLHMLTTKIRPLSNLWMKWGSFLLMGTKRYKISHENHFTVSLIVGVSGVKYVKIVEGSSSSVDLVQFLGEAGNSYTDNGGKVFQRGDSLIVDNAPTHHYMSEVVLRNWLPTIGIQYLNLPSYSLHLNPAEFCFRKVKILLKTENTANIHPRMSK